MALVRSSFSLSLKLGAVGVLFPSVFTLTVLRWFSSSFVWQQVVLPLILEWLENMGALLRQPLPCNCSDVSLDIFPSRLTPLQPSVHQQQRE